MDYQKFLDRSRKNRERIYRLSDSGKSPVAIANQLKISRQRVHQILLARRTNGE